jgi:hypothetical protein
MVNASASSLDPVAGKIAAWSAVVGFLTAIMIAAISGRLSLAEREGASVLGDLGAMAAFMAPFVAVLASFLSHDLEVRRAFWLAGGVLALILAGFSIFSGLWILFGPVGAGLFSAWWLTKGRAGLLGPARSIALTSWLILCLGFALGVLHLRETPGCWSATEYGPDSEALSTNEVCWSDRIDDTEGLFALGGVALGLAGMAFLARGDNAERLVVQARTIGG